MELQMDLLFQFLTALGLGALIGAEREMNKAKQLADGVGFAGPRTLGLVSILGFVGAFLSEKISFWILVVLLAAIVFFFLAQYVGEFQKMGTTGNTSEMAALITFLVGVMAYYEPLLAVILAVVTVLVLNFKKPLHSFISHLESQEFLSAIKFIIVAFVVLPLLPKDPIDPWGLISLANAWLVVVLVSAISFTGYILIKAIGTKKGLGVTALLGGLASSTATTISMAQQGHRNKKVILPFVFGIIIASTIMFGRALVEVAIVNQALLNQMALVLGTMMAVSVVVLLFLWIMGNKKTTKTEELTLSSPFRLLPALQFGILYILILLIAEFGNQYFGQKGVYVASFISGLADVDAITLSLSNLSATAKLEDSIAVQGISIAVLTNTLVKLIYVRIFGSAVLFRWTALALLPVMLSGLGVLFFI